MKKIEASKLNRSLKVVLDGVAKGDKYEVTRYGKVVAKILPPGAREATMTVKPARDIVVGPDPEPYTPNATPGTPMTPEQIRQKRRDYLHHLIANKPKKDG